jgi:hypothetical protein
LTVALLSSPNREKNAQRLRKCCAEWLYYYLKKQAETFFIGTTHTGTDSFSIYTTFLNVILKDLVYTI